MIEQFKDAMVRGGATWVLWLLVSLSILSVGVMLDRARVFWFSKDDLATLVQELHRLLGLRDLEGAKRRLASSPSAEAAVALAGLVQWERGAGAAREAMAAATGLQRARLERRLLFLGTVGNNARSSGSSAP